MRSRGLELTHTRSFREMWVGGIRGAQRVLRSVCSQCCAETQEESAPRVACCVVFLLARPPARFCLVLVCSCWPGARPVLGLGLSPFPQLMAALGAAGSAPAVGVEALCVCPQCYFMLLSIHININDYMINRHGRGAHESCCRCKTAAARASLACNQGGHVWRERYTTRGRDP